MNWGEERASKQTTRALAVKGHRHRHGAIFLPGWDSGKLQAGADIRFALAEGHLDQDCPLYAVECDKNVYSLISEDLATLGFRDLRPHRGQLQTLKLDGAIDFAFIDLWGGLDKGLLRWMERELQPRLLPETMLSLTVGFAIRNPFMRKAAIVMEEHYPHLLDWTEEKLHLRKPERQIPYILVRMALRQHHFALTERLPYQDSRVSMLYYKFSDFMADANTGWPSLDEFIALSDLVTLKNDGNGGDMGDKGRDDIGKPRDDDESDTSRDHLKLVWHDNGVSIAYGSKLLWSGDDLHQLQSRAMGEILKLTS
jgi:hypothetical protein